MPPGGGCEAIPPHVFTGVPATVKGVGYKDALMHCRKSSLPRDSVDKALKTIEGEAPWASHEEWCLPLAALSTDMRRSLGKHKTNDVCWSSRGRLRVTTGTPTTQPCVSTAEAYVSCCRHGNHW